VYGDNPLTIFGGKVTKVTDKAVVIEPGTRVNCFAARVSNAGLKHGGSGAREDGYVSFRCEFSASFASFPSSRARAVIAPTRVTRTKTVMSASMASQQGQVSVRAERLERDRLRSG
jgi:hypothetical protein